MPSLYRAIFTAIQVFALVAFLGVSLMPRASLASPLPVPMPFRRVFADTVQTSGVALRSQEARSHSVGNSTVSGLSWHSAINHGPRDDVPLVHERDVGTSILDNMNLLSSSYTQLNQNAQVINNLASSDRTAPGYSQQYATALSGFQANLLNVQNVLAALATDKGLADYDRQVELETLIKDIVNSVKYTLNDTVDVVDSIPGIGPLLAPIIYDIKCIIDDTLDIVENLTDALINDLLPLLQALGIQATQTACTAGIQIAGLCLL
ncbi:uncharacterized protein FIBRA_04053 [Fibroporia radiculosa]|uniref:Uncharacterized protein n=1 Tax=Fibroporia radiculosa TaxID=599839 RepID=J4GNW4_9APHY|nr:uncharacterized protein FIBRA_04053 [Fibroporia radiculosa]CCM01980.1 predicted protein [Fibroporia radiculosa]